MPASISEDYEKILGRVAQYFADQGDALAVAVLASAESSIEVVDPDDNGFTMYAITLMLPESLFEQADGNYGYKGSLTSRICNSFSRYARFYEGEQLDHVRFKTEYAFDEHWRDKAIAWISGEGITNQGRARSDNLAPRMVDGLLFRSQPEINLYRAFKSMGVTFAPLPVFVRGGESYRRIEPDFVIIKDGILMIVEVDGDVFHNETPVEAHNRTTMLAHEGAHIERVRATDCETIDLARETATKLMAIHRKLKANK